MEHLHLYRETHTQTHDRKTAVALHWQRTHQSSALLPLVKGIFTVGFCSLTASNMENVFKSGRHHGRPQTMIHLLSTGGHPVEALCALSRLLHRHQGRLLAKTIDKSYCHLKFSDLYICVYSVHLSITFVCKCVLHIHIYKSENHKLDINLIYIQMYHMCTWASANYSTTYIIYTIYIVINPRNFGQCKRSVSHYTCSFIHIWLRSDAA